VCGGGGGGQNVFDIRCARQIRKAQGQGNGVTLKGRIDTANIGGETSVLGAPSLACEVYSRDGGRGATKMSSSSCCLLTPAHRACAGRL
jgi:hypothetical protein